MSYWTHTAGHRTGSANQHERLGHPGRYTEVYTHRGGQMIFTGSMFGYGAILLGSGSAADNGSTSYVELSGGGRILLSEFGHFTDADAGRAINPILDFSLFAISSSNNENIVYCFKRQQ
jgi:hypothetical protein